MTRTSLQVLPIRMRLNLMVGSQVWTKVLQWMIRLCNLQGMLQPTPQGPGPLHYLLRPPHLLFLRLLPISPQEAIVVRQRCLVQQPDLYRRPGTNRQSILMKTTTLIDIVRLGLLLLEVGVRQ